MKVGVWAIEKLIFYARNSRDYEEVPMILRQGSIGTYLLLREVCDAAA